MSFVMFFSMCLSSCGQQKYESTYMAYITDQQDNNELSKQYYSNIKITIMNVEEGQNDKGKATVKVSLPDLKSVLDSILSKGEDINNTDNIEESLLNTVSKYKLVKEITLDVIKDDEKGWKLDSVEQINQLIDESIEEFLLYAMLNHDWDNFEYEEVKLK